jgi:hypothetical protein
MMMLSCKRLGCAAAVLAVMTVGCDKVQLLAPTNSTVTLNTASSFVPTGGTTQLTAFVAESSGTPVHDGTTVRFNTNLGRVDPAEAQTQNGYAVATFMAGDFAGVAVVSATSGAAGAASGTAGSSSSGSAAETITTSNVRQITVGAAGVKTVLLTANPGSVPSTGGNVELVASVVSETGGALPNVPVTFSSSDGQLSAVRVPTDANGQARTTLTIADGQGSTSGTSTAVNITVKATAGAVTSSDVTVTRRPPGGTASATLAAKADTAVPGSGGQTVTFTATVTVTPADASVQPTKYEWEFGDGNSATSFGNIVTHVYTKDPGSVKHATVRIYLTNGQIVDAGTDVLLGQF